MYIVPRLVICHLMLSSPPLSEQLYAEKAAAERDADKRDMQRRLVEKLTAAIDKVEAAVKQGGDLTEAKQASHGADGYGWLGSGLSHCGRDPAQIVSESRVSDAMLFAAEYLQAYLCDCYPLSATVAFTIPLQSSRSLTELCVFQLLLSEASDPPAEWLDGHCSLTVVVVCISVVAVGGQRPPGGVAGRSTGTLGHRQLYIRRPPQTLGGRVPRRYGGTQCKALSGGTHSCPEELSICEPMWRVNTLVSLFLKRRLPDVCCCFYSSL